MQAEDSSIRLIRPITGTDAKKETVHDLCLINSKEVRIHPSTKEIAAYVCNKPGCNYIIQNNAWQIPMDMCAQLISEGFFSKSKIKGTPLSVIKQLAANTTTKQDENHHNPVMTQMQAINSKETIFLKPHQIEGIKIAVKRNYRVLIADEMGLGKTLQAISIARTLLETHKFNYDRCNQTKLVYIVIFAPASNVQMWINEAKKFITEESYDIKNFTPSPPTYQNQAKNPIVLVSSYAGALTKITKIDLNDVILGIADESQNLKNPESKRASILVPFLSKLKHVLLLSGTPALSNPNELYTQIKIINPSLFSYLEYHERYCRVADNHYNALNPRLKQLVKYRGSKNLDELKVILKELVMIRRVKKECLSLGEKKRILVTFSTDLVKKELNSNLKINSKTLQNELLSEYNQSAKDKVSDLILFIKELKMRVKGKIIVFAHHTEILTSIYQEFIKNAVIITGSTPKAKRETICTKFKEDLNINLAVLSLKACSTGLTLVCATTVVFAELPWTPGDLHQAEDRIYRIGQLETVRIYYLIASYVDKYMWPLLRRKNNMLNTIGIIEKEKEDLTFEDFDPKQKKLNGFGLE
ncbi:SWI/SNF-related matrix-associated actin-dependent regulator of chromatin subfamily A-like protein 1 [Nematocida ausubeli]|nr:SWI/SNF-related matrix-associated actin-dependent regulator of chromatin subfamily A-like protein 1 [Nematocida ausubeli]